MSTFNYERPAATAVRMIKKYGGPRTLIRKVQDLTDLARPVIVDTPTACTGVDFDVTTEQVNGTTILMGDKVAYIAPDLLVAAIPNRDIYVDKAGIRYTITKVERLAPDETVVLWTFWLRK